MTLRGSLIVFAIGTVLAWIAWGLVLTTVPPTAAGILGEAFFFGSFFLALTGTLTILGVLGRARLSPAVPSVHLSAAFRQAFLIALGTVGALILQRFHVLQWWNMLTIIGILLLIDVVLTGRRRHTHQ